MSPTSGNFPRPHSFADSAYPIQYDPRGDYIRQWLPQLAEVPTNRIQCPWTLSPKDFSKYVPDGSYPKRPVLEQQSWKAHYTRRGPSKQGVPNRNERVKNPGPLIVSGGAARGGGGGGNGQGNHKDGKHSSSSDNSPRRSTEARDRESRVIDQVVRKESDHHVADSDRERVLS